jgi:hypothetical protein
MTIDEVFSMTLDEICDGSLPDPGDVALNVPVGHTVGRAVLTEAAVQTALMAVMAAQSFIGLRSLPRDPVIRPCCPGPRNPVAGIAPAGSGRPAPTKNRVIVSHRAVFPKISPAISPNFFLGRSR